MLIAELNEYELGFPLPVPSKVKEHSGKVGWLRGQGLWARLSGLSDTVLFLQITLSTGMQHWITFDIFFQIISSVKHLRI